MAANVILVEAQPRRASDGVAGTVRLAGGGAKFPYDYGGVHWSGGITGLPRSIGSLDFEGDQPGGGGVSQALALEWAPGTNDKLDTLASLIWTDAPIVVRIGPENGNRALPPIVTGGKVLDASVEGGVLRIALADDTADLKRPLLVDRFTGEGGIEGPIEWDGMLKPRAWGRCFNVVGRPIDTANNIWCFGDPTRPWLAFDSVRDMGAATELLSLLGWQGSAAATFAALQAAVAPPGGGVACPSIACVKWWTEPSGDLRADIRGEHAGGYVESAPEIVWRIVAARSGLGFAPGTIAAAVAARPMPFGYFEDKETVSAADAISEILGDVSISWPVVDGLIHLRPWDWSPPVIEAVSVDVRRTKLHKPVGTRRLGYRRNQAPMPRGDLAAIVLSRDVVYEDGTPLETLRPAEGGATAGAILGNASNPGNIRPIGPGNNYIEIDLKTLLGTAASFIGQGALATLSQIANGSSYLSGFGSLSAVNSVSFGSSYLTETSGGPSATLSGFKTALGTAAAITGQGAFATVNSAGYGSPLLTGFGGLAAREFVALGLNGAGGITNSAGTAWLSESELVTAIGTAASIIGQAAAATDPTIQSGATNDRGDDTRDANFGPEHYRTNYLRRLRTEFKLATAVGLTAAIGLYGTLESYAAFVDHTGGPVWQRFTDGGGRTYIRRSSGSTGSEAWSSWSVDYSENRKPGFGGDIVETTGGTVASLAGFKTVLGTAAAITGQGAFATVSSAGYGSPLLTGFGGLAAREFVALGLNGAGGITNSAGTAWLSESELVTSIGTAAAIVGQAAAATDPTVQTGATNDRGDDTRSINAPPSFYRTNWLFRRRSEFKELAVLGLATGPSAGVGIYGMLVTDTPWVNQSGGPVTQSLIDSGGRRWLRYSQGTSPDESWGNWSAEFNGNRPPIFGDDVLESWGIPATLGNFKTGLGAAASIVGQAAWATYAGLPPSRLETIEPGADVTANSVPIIEPPGAQTVNADFQGTPLSGQLPRQLTTIRRRGVANVSTTTAWSYIGLNCSIAAGVNGVVTVNAMTGNSAAVIISSLRDGVVLEAVVPVTKISAAPPVSGGSGSPSFSRSISTAVTDTSWDGTPQLLASGTMATNASGQVSLSIALDYYSSANDPSFSSTVMLAVKWQTSIDGTTWTDLSGNIFGSKAFQEGYDPTAFPEIDGSYPGSIFSVETYAGLSATSTYQFRLIAHRAEQANNAQANTSGNISGSHP